MNNLKITISLIVLATTATNTYAVSYECEVDGEIIYQPKPCEGVVYPENLTKESRYGGTNVSLSDLLTARGAVLENQPNTTKSNKRSGKRR